MERLALQRRRSAGHPVVFHRLAIRPVEVIVEEDIPFLGRREATGGKGANKGEDLVSAF